MLEYRCRSIFLGFCCKWFAATVNERWKACLTKNCRLSRWHSLNRSAPLQYLGPVVQLVFNTTCVTLIDSRVHLTGTLNVETNQQNDNGLLIWCRSDRTNPSTREDEKVNGIRESKRKKKHLFKTRLSTIKFKPPRLNGNDIQVSFPKLEMEMLFSVTFFDNS